MNKKKIREALINALMALDEAEQKSEAVSKRKDLKSKNKIKLKKNLTNEQF